MLSFFRPKANEAKQEEQPYYEGDSKTCIDLFVPGPIIQLYQQMKKYIADNGENPPENSTLYAWTGLGKTNQYIVKDVITLIEGKLSFDLEDFLKLKEQYQNLSCKENKRYSSAVYQIARKLPSVLKLMPTEKYSAFFTGGSKVRKAIESVINYYTKALDDNWFPCELDVEQLDNKLALFLKPEL